MLTKVLNDHWILILLIVSVFVCGVIWILENIQNLLRDILKELREHAKH